MGRIAILDQYGRAIRGETPIDEAVGNPGGGSLVTADIYQPGGDDSQPLPGDYMVTVTMPGSGREAAVGFLDNKNARVTGPGEKRIYARQADGTAIADIVIQADGSVTTTTPNSSATLAADGSIVFSNSSGGITLQAGGAVDINGVVFDTSGNVTAPAGTKIEAPTVTGTTSLKVGILEMGTHIHVVGSPNTGGPIGP